ncbi:synaptonemal complex protein 1 isoform X1 [Astyanax mexicanus]|uniref:synaptonemal complex protein 1 isoform X1 n=1 Tax=Astyanax mexicanus TaxID=7994 RepID=UPI0020CAA512|nr:synaptonemal complex protein 1 isoform X1 [Astyanax mexicanus]
MERAFNFKLLVPPRTNLGQVSAVKPQDSRLFEDNSSFKPLIQSYTKCFDTEASLPFSNTNMVLPTKPQRAEVTKKIAVMPMEKEEGTLRCSQLYSKLFEEAEKIKSWKLKTESEILQKDRKLQENRRTIETQRKAIQELQFGNESLSMKLEERLNENEDLRNKNNATRNLCNILKDTFERSTEKMGLYESEREETHGLFMQNLEDIQRMVAAFESLRLKAEADQLEMLKVREGLKQFDDLKLQFENEYHMKEKEISILTEKLREKESDLKEILLSFQETQKAYSDLQKSAKLQHELLQNSKQEQDKLEEKLNKADQIQQETEKHQKALANLLEQTKENYAVKLQERDAKLLEVNNIKEQMTHKLEEMKMAVESLHCSLKSEKQRAQDLESKLGLISEGLDKKDTELGKIAAEKEEQDNQIHTLKQELDTKSNALESLEDKIKTDGDKILQLITEHKNKQAQINELKEQLKIASTENKNMVVTLEEITNEQKQIKELVFEKEIKLKDIEGKLAEALKNERQSSTNIQRLKKELNQQKEMYKDLLERFNQLQLQKDAVQEQVDGGSTETRVLESCLKETKENEEKLKMEVERLELEKQQLETQVEVLGANIEEQRQEIETFQKQLKDSSKSTHSELMKKERQIKAQELKMTNMKTKLETKTKELDESLKENKTMKKQMTLDNEKLFQFEDELTKLKEESKKHKKHHDEELRKVCSELKDKSASEAQLSLEVQDLKQSAVNAVKSKEDTEIKCQQKISDMVALMERHKHEYDKMVEEKDAELNEKRIREAEVNTNKISLELELSHLQIENGHLKQQLEKVKMEKEKIRQEVEELTRMQTSQNSSFMEKEEHLEKEIQSLKKQIESLEKEKAQKISKGTAKKKSCETPNKVPACAISDASKKALTTPLKLGDLLQTPTWTMGPKIGATPRIKSFRVRTPPSTENSAPWRKNTLALDPKSDGSEQNDILSFSPAPSTLSMSIQAKEPGAECLSLLKKVQGSGVHKSPGAALKLAAMKRMRDAGWTTITTSEKKKKKATDKIFA